MVWSVQGLTTDHFTNHKTLRLIKYVHVMINLCYRVQLISHLLYLCCELGLTRVKVLEQHTDWKFIISECWFASRILLVTCLYWMAWTQLGQYHPYCICEHHILYCYFMFRLRNVCTKFIDEIGEEDIYAAYSKNPGSRREFENFLCRRTGVFGNCSNTKRTSMRVLDLWILQFICFYCAMQNARIFHL